MKKKYYYLTLDTETAGDLEKPLIYDLGGCVHDRHGNIMEKFSFVITDVFSDKATMATAYYCEKIPQYLYGLARGDWTPITFYEARCYILDLLKKYNIKKVIAYNATFDRKALNNTMSALTNGKYHFFFPKDVVWYDSWAATKQVIANQKRYQNYAATNNYMTNHKTPRPRTTAEIVYRYLTDNKGFIESHTALSDAIIETFIMAKCWGKHKKMEFAL